MNVSGELINHPGIYCIVNKTRGSMYVGKTKSLSKRYASHLHYLRNRKHSVMQLQVDFLCGDDMWFMVLEHLERDVDDLRMSFLEQWWLNSASTHFEIYNQRRRVLSASPGTYWAILELLQRYNSKL